MGFMDWLRGGLRRMTDRPINNKNIKTVFDIEGVPQWHDFYFNGILPWKSVYQGYYKPWHFVHYVTPERENAERDMFRLCIAKAATQELASLIWSERCAVNVSREGYSPDDDADDPLSEFVNSVLAENNFSQKFGEHIERSMALGGGAIKAWYDTKERRIKIGYVTADQFVPTRWDNALIYDAIFISRETKQDKTYTRLEWHKNDNGICRITNDVYVSDNADGKNDILGTWVPISGIYPEIEAETEIKNVNSPLFAYYRVASANNLNDNTPLGISIYANAMHTLRELDEAFDGFCSFIHLGKPQIYVPYRMLRPVPDEHGMMRHYYDPASAVYAGLNVDNSEAFEIKDMTISLHVDEHVDAINGLLNMLCLQTGFSQSTFTFDAHSGIKTATEVISEDSKTYKTVKNNQENIRVAVERLVDCIITVAKLYDVQFNGQSVSALADGGYSVSVVFDDNIIQDKQKNLENAVMLMNNGLLSKKAVLTDERFGIGLTPEQADAMLEQIAAENRQINAEAVDMFRTFGGD